jgi:hypothetical protein
MTSRYPRQAPADVVSVPVGNHHVAQAAQLDQIPSTGVIAASDLLAETGRFSHARRLTLRG